MLYWKQSMVRPAAHYYPENEDELWEAAFPPISQDLQGFTAQAEGERAAVETDANTDSLRQHLQWPRY